MNIEISTEVALALGYAAVKRADEIEAQIGKFGFSGNIEEDLKKLADGLRLVAAALFKVPV